MWGGNSEGQLGLGEEHASVNTPTKLELDEKVTCVACGYYHTAVVTGTIAYHHLTVTLIPDYNQL